MLSNEDIMNLLNLISLNWDRLSRSGQDVATDLFDDADKGMSFGRFRMYLIDLCWDFDRMGVDLQREMQHASKQLGFEI